MNKALSCSVRLVKRQMSQSEVIVPWPEMAAPNGTTSPLGNLLCSSAVKAAHMLR